MADGWRNRKMAPAYALVISFVLVLVFGLVLHRGEPQKGQPRDEPTTSTVGTQEDGTGWKFRVAQIGKNPVRHPENLPAFAMSGRTVTPVGRLEDLRGGDGGNGGNNGDGGVIVCVDLPEDWSMPEPNTEIGDFTCSVPLKPTRKDTVTVQITRSGS